jgi:hypothetical protein
LNAAGVSCSIGSAKIAVSPEALEGPGEIRLDGNGQRSARGDDSKEYARAVCALGAAREEHVEAKFANVPHVDRLCARPDLLEARRLGGVTGVIGGPTSGVPLCAPRAVPVSGSEPHATHTNKHTGIHARLMSRSFSQRDAEGEGWSQRNLEIAVNLCEPSFSRIRHLCETPLIHGAGTLARHLLFVALSAAAHRSRPKARAAWRARESSARDRCNGKTGFEHHVGRR